MTRFAEAEWRPVPNFAPGGMTVLGLCPHVIVGSLSGADATFHNKSPNQRGGRRSAHFGVGKDGRLLQWVDTKDRAWAQAAGNPFYVSAECEGLDSEPHTPAQIVSLARLLAWLHETDAVPFAVVDHPGDRGVISHRNGGAAWGGHSCPGDQRHAQRGEIVARAAHLVLPVPGSAPLAGPEPAPHPIVSTEVDVPPGHKQFFDFPPPPTADGRGWRYHDVPLDKVAWPPIAQGGNPPKGELWPTLVFAANEEGGGFWLDIQLVNWEAGDVTPGYTLRWSD